jgi:hypothetical protein
MKRIVVSGLLEDQNEVIVLVSCKGGISWPGDLAKRDVVAEKRGRGGGRESRKKRCRTGLRLE